jgi:hypothetical protein
MKSNSFFISKDMMSGTGQITPGIPPNSETLASISPIDLETANPPGIVRHTSRFFIEEIS